MQSQRATGGGHVYQARHDFVGQLLLEDRELVNHDKQARERGGTTGRQATSVGELLVLLELLDTSALEIALPAVHLAGERVQRAHHLMTVQIGSTAYGVRESSKSREGHTAFEVHEDEAQLLRPIGDSEAADQSLQ